MNVSRDTIRLACLGTGYISGVHARCASAVEGVRLEAVWSRSQESGRRFAEKHGVPRVYTDYRQLLKDSEVDAVIIGLPTPMHHAVALQAAKAGKHILCEKPIAMTVEEGEEMIRSAAAAGVVMMIAHVLRFWPEYVAAQQLTESGSLGRIVSLSAHRLSSVPRWSSNDWLLDAGQSGGVPVDLHIHDIDFIRWLLGEPSETTAIGIRGRDGLINDVVSLFRFKDALAHAHASYALPEGAKFRAGYRLIGERGILEYDNLLEPTLRLSQNGNAQPLPTLPSVEPYRAQLEYFAECVRRRAKPLRCPAEESLRSLALSLMIKSIAENPAHP